MPPLTPTELLALEAQIPCPLPPEVRELLSTTRGFAQSPLESVDFAGLGGWEWSGLFPAGLPLAHDGFGNHWVVDLTPISVAWGPIFYVAHDPPVIVYQAPDLHAFLTQLVDLWTPPYTGALDAVHEGAASRIWRENPGMVPAATWRQSRDALQQAFAHSLDDAYLCIDLRAAQLGDGLSWGRYGPHTTNTRFGWERLFAYQQQKPWWQRLMNRSLS